MNYDWQIDLRPRRRTTAALFPPSTVEEAAWDILTALYSDQRCELGLDKLSCMASLPPRTVNEWLATLEERQIIMAVSNEITGELCAVLTGNGRALLDRYLSAANDLQVGARH